MKFELSSMGLTYSSEAGLRVLDQRLLPDQEVWVDVKNPEHMVELIQGLAVRGAPLIGVAAALELACYAMSLKSSYSKNLVAEAAQKLRDARPTAVNLLWAIDRMLSHNPDLNPDSLFQTAVKIFEEDVQMCADMSNAGAALIKDGDGILTICNTGGLATVGIGTALGVIRRAAEQGKKIHVYFCETRPLLQGGRLTAWELQKLGIPHTLICDSMAATLMLKGKIQKCFVGSDRIAANGDFANKIGTYNLAVLAKHHGVPFYPVAPWSTVDPKCPNGAAIPIEERSSHEVLGVSGSFGSVRWAPKHCQVFNPAFDVTPALLASGIVLNTGIHSVQEFSLKVLANANS
jgi:methylthioribose-1-phosphate isomerase